MSRETTEANAIARAARLKWKGHSKHCATCATAARSRHWDKLCRAGAELYHDHKAASDDLAKNRALDKLPSPDQESIF